MGGDDLGQQLADALAELDAAKKKGEGGFGTKEDMEELERLRKEHEAAKAAHKKESMQRMKDMFAIKSAHQKQQEMMAMLKGKQADKDGKIGDLEKQLRLNRLRLRELEEANRQRRLGGQAWKGLPSRRGIGHSQCN